MKQYDEVTLRKLQSVQRGILQDFQEICQKHGLKYFISGGTAIGAIRHQGMIPWDDDIDVCMLREAYERFLKVAPQEMGEKYDFLFPGRPPAYVMMFTKMSLKHTTFVEDTDQNRKYHSGIFIDVFPYDQTAVDPKARQKQIRKTWLWARLTVLRHYARPKLPPGLPGYVKAPAWAACALIHAALQVMPSSFFIHRYHAWATRYNGEDTGLYTDFAYPYPEKLLIQKDELYPSVTVTLNELQVETLRGYHRYLTSQYGEYMKLPPQEERKNHFPALLDFGDYE